MKEKDCTDCWHNYHCPMPQEGYDFNPDDCPYNPDNEKKEKNIVERLIDGTDNDTVEWEETSSYLAFTAKYDGRLYYIIQYSSGETIISIMNDSYDFEEMSEFTDTGCVKALYKKILRKYPEYKKNVERCLDQMEEENEDEWLKREIEITPEFADVYDGRCFFDLDMSDRIELVKFMKTPTGIDILCIGCDYHWGYSHLYHDDYGKHLIQDTFCGSYTAMIEEGRWLMKETTQEVFDQVNVMVHDMMSLDDELKKDFEKLQKKIRPYQ